MFNILSPVAIAKIVRMQIDIVKRRLQNKNIKLSVSKKVLDYLSKEGYTPQYGARPLKRLIQKKILTTVASLMISAGVMDGGEVAVDMKKGEIDFKVKKQGKKVIRKKKKPSAKKEKVVA